ncbi:MAG TPA: DUF6443 domain-containing protein, partial [Chitinophagaceae bacterium]|nr:DUF6443 domain-containing protein [Chitinophagaceae bacterium]
MRKLLSHIFFSALFLLAGHSGIAQEKVYKGVIPNLTVNPQLFFVENSNPLIVTDPVYADVNIRPLLGPVLKMQNVVMLKINEEVLQYVPNNFITDVTVEITKTKLDGTQEAPIQKMLHLDYKIGMAQKSDAASYYVDDNGGYSITIVIKIISKNVTWDITPFLEIVGEIHSSYDQPFICTAYVTGLTNTAGGDCGSTADELAVSWNYPNPGSSFTSFPTDYDLEWAWVDNDAADAYKTNGSFDAEKIFFNNATRVTVPITQNCYKIPMLYDGAGFIFYRVRAVQVRTDGQIINGVWTTTLDADAGKYTLAAGHEESLNWQVSTTYAEDGKRKTVISYFDGTLRSRQTVTKDNSQETPSTVVAETFYDYQGRPTIQVLPAPTLNTVIAFTKNFNRAAGNEGYPKELYDILQTGQTVCGNGAPALDKTANLDGVRGAGNYYSPLNPKVNEGFNKFIPDANGYAFTETRYTQDATGRLLSQGGVGQLHQLGSTHETKYFYSSPSQDEIDILFGTDAGIASHYEKNMVRDANGQYSVSYVDMHGRTVATALTGVSPVNLEALPSLNGLPVPNPNNWNDVPKKQLLDPETNVVNGRSITMTKTLLVTSPGVRHFEYRLDPQQLQLNRCNPPGGTICYDCLYDLTITITNDCDNSVLFTDTRKNFSLPYNSVCGTNPADINFDFDVNISVEGSYTITKILTLSKDAQDQFRTNAMQYQNLVCK